MEGPSVFRFLSPLDHRYYLANRELFDRLQDYLSEEAAVRYCVRAEAALLETYVREFLDSDEELLSVVRSLPERITPGEVYAEEEKTRHNVRALVNVICRSVPETLVRYVHLGATSVDILDTAQSMRIRDAVREVVVPLLLDVEEELIALARKEADTAQVGRTHGQHAVPITFGFAVAEYVSRLGQCIVEIDERSNQLRGKLAGAVGAYNATSMVVSDPEALERTYLSFLGLKPADYANQIVEPEHLLRLLLELNTAFGVIANLADDLRHLQRSELAEVQEHFSSSQVGSSTMPQKRNPWNSEHVKSLWKAFHPRVLSFFQDQISEHQRDLTNSASSRFVGEFVAGLVAAANRMLSVVRSLHVDAERMLENVRSGGDRVLAEPIYILLALSGVTDAHEKVRRLTLASDREGTGLLDQLRADTETWGLIRERMRDRVGVEAEDLFARPELYCGRAASRARNTAQKYQALMNEIREGLHGAQRSTEL